jgi:hypothetical protein
MVFSTLEVLWYMCASYQKQILILPLKLEEHTNISPNSNLQTKQSFETQQTKRVFFYCVYLLKHDESSLFDWLSSKFTCIRCR